MALDPIRESTPVNDLHDVSKFLKDPLTPAESSSNRSSHQINLVTPSSLPLPAPSTVKSLISHLPKTSELKAVVQCKQQEIIQNGNDLLVAIRIVIIQILSSYSSHKLILLQQFLSNSRNIWSLTAMFELLCIISLVVPWKFLQVRFILHLTSSILDHRGSGPSFN